MTTNQNIKEQIAKLEQQVAELRKKEVAIVIAGIRAKMNEFKLTVADLGLTTAKVVKSLTKTSAKRKKPMPPKYRDPVSGKTWNGHGKAPVWLAVATKKGLRDNFLIDKTAAASVEAKTPAAAPAKKTTATAKKVAKKKPAKPAAAKKTAAPKKPVTSPLAKVVTKKAAAKTPAKKKPRAAAAKKTPTPIPAPTTTA